MAVAVLQPGDEESTRKEEVKMTRCNVGGYDRAARLALGTVLMAAGLGLAVSQQLPRPGRLVTHITAGIIPGYMRVKEPQFTLIRPDIGIG